MRPPFLPGATLLLLSAVSAGAQETRTLDLSVAPEHDTVPLNPGRYQFRVKNLSPRYDYTISISEGMETIPPIPIDGTKGTRAVCPKLDSANNALDSASKEEDVPSLVRQTQEAQQAVNNDKQCGPAIRRAATLILRTEYQFDDVFDLVAGGYVVLDVARIEKDTTTKKSRATRRWQRRYTTGPPGEWHPTYGYAFPAFVSTSHWHLVRGAQRYFLKQIGDSGSRYLISAERPTRQFDAVPTVMFAYERAGNSDVRGHLFVAGLAADLTKPVIFLGTGITYFSNLVIAVGIAARQEPVLMGQYRVGDTVRTNLTQEQLLRDEFRVRPFLSVTLRFDKNPFKKDSTAGAQATGEKAQKGAANNGSGAAAPKPDSTPSAKPDGNHSKDQSKAVDPGLFFFGATDEQDKRTQ